MGGNYLDSCAPNYLDSFRQKLSLKWYYAKIASFGQPCWWKLHLIVGYLGFYLEAQRLGRYFTPRSLSLAASTINPWESPSSKFLKPPISAFVKHLICNKRERKDGNSGISEVLKSKQRLTIIFPNKSIFFTGTMQNSRPFLSKKMETF